MEPENTPPPQLCWPLAFLKEDRNGKHFRITQRLLPGAFSWGKEVGRAWSEVNRKDKTPSNSTRRKLRDSFFACLELLFCGSQRPLLLLLWKSFFIPKLNSALFFKAQTTKYSVFMWECSREQAWHVPLWASEQNRSYKHRCGEAGKGKATWPLDERIVSTYMTMPRDHKTLVLKGILLNMQTFLCLNSFVTYPSNNFPALDYKLFPETESLLLPKTALTVGSFLWVRPKSSSVRFAVPSSCLLLHLVPLGTHPEFHTTGGWEWASWLQLLCISFFCKERVMEVSTAYRVVVKI